MTAMSINDQIEALPYGPRIALKLRAKAVRDEILNRVPDLCRHPFDGLLTEVCVVSAFDDHETGNTHDGQTMTMARDIFDGMGDREDASAILANSEDGMVLHRGLEAGFRSLSRTLDNMISDGFALSATHAPAPVR